MPCFNKVVRGVAPPTNSGTLPKVSNGLLDRILAGVANDQGISLIKYDVNPAFLAPATGFSMYGVDRANGVPLQAARSAVTKVAADAAFNGRPVIEFTAGSGDTINQSSDLRMEIQPPDSFTVFVVASIAASLKTTPVTSRLIFFGEPGKTICSLSLLSTGTVSFGTSSSSAESAIPVGNVPAANVAGVYAFTYDKVANMNGIYLNNATMIDNYTPPTPYAFSSATRIGFGGPARASSAAGWLGKLGRADLFTGVLSTANFTTVMNGYKAEFGIA